MLTVFISWTCYGQWLHGDARGSVDMEHNSIDEPWLPPTPSLHEFECEALSQPPYQMDSVRRVIVRDAIVGVCQYRGWTLHALHVRALHVHVVVEGDATPEKIMNDFKAYASRALNQHGADPPDRKRWTRHGSTRYINDDNYLNAAVNYTLFKQGEPMERWPLNPLPDGRGLL